MVVVAKDNWDPDSVAASISPAEPKREVEELLSAAASSSAMRGSAVEQEGGDVCARLCASIAARYGFNMASTADEETCEAVRELHGVRVEWARGERGWKMTEVAGSEFSMRADLVLIAMGFTHTAHEGLVKDSGLALDARGNILADEENRTSRPKVFAAGDASRGASLVAHALASGREAARAIDRKLR